MKRPRTKAERHAHLASIVRQELVTAEGGEDDELQAQRAEALDYYLGKPRGDEVPGRSRVISTDVADNVNALLALMRDMLIADAEVSFDATGDDDEAAARAESDIVNDVLMKDNDGEQQILAAVKDGLILKNGCIKVEVRDLAEVQRSSAEGADPAELGAYVEAAEDGETRRVEGAEVISERVRRQFVVRAVPIENISYQASYDGPLQGLRFFSERITPTRSDLIEMGIPRAQVMELPPWTDTETNASQRRNVSYQPGSDAETPDQDQILCHESYVRTDLDGDGVSELYRVLTAGQESSTCLKYEPVPMIPYALGAPFIVPHRLTGESIFDRLKTLQDENTALMRQAIDNVTVINNGRYAYDPSKVTEADIMAPKAGGGIRTRDMNAIMPLAIPDMLSGILAMLQWNKRQVSPKVGAALDMSSAEAQTANKAATVASIEKGNQELMANLVAANFASGLLRQLYLILHAQMRLYSDRAYPVRVAGQTMPMDPRQWPVRTRLTVRAGRTPTEKAQIQMALGQHMQLLAQAMASGMDGILADAQTLYRTSQEWLRYSGVPESERYGVNPASPGAQEAAQRQAAQAQQMAQMQAQMAQLEAQQEAAKLREDARQADQSLAFDYFKAQLEAETKEAEMTASGVIEIEREAMARAERARAAAAGAGPAGAAGTAGGARA